MRENARITKAINDVAEMLDRGVAYVDILRQIRTDYGVSSKTVDNYIKKAKLILAERNKAKEQARQEATQAAIIEAANELLMSDLEIEGRLCALIKGGVSVEELVRGDAVLRDVSPSEIVQAAKVLFAKRGSNAPYKVANTDTQGKDVKAPLTNEQFIELLNAAKAPTNKPK